ncbi:MAG: flagellar protein FliT [Pseudomonadota bacterium]
MNMVVEDYQRLSEYTGKMAAAAAAGEWDELIALEQRCTAHVATLKTRDGVPADESARQQKVALIKKILADDKAIRDKTEPWMRQLERIMQSARSTQRLQQAYLSQG